MSEHDLQDAILRTALELQRLSAHEEAEAEAILRELEAELRQLLATSLDERTKRSVEALIKQADEAINARYATVADALDTHGLVMLVSERTVETLKIISPSIAKPTAETLASLADNVLIQGAPTADWWRRQAEDTAFRFAGVVRQGVINGETNERIVARITGRVGEPGILDIARRNARALVHSSIMSAANDARLATYRKNARFIKGVRWIAALDGHICRICAAMDGQAWNLDGEKLKGTKVDFRSPPAHWNCFTGGTLVSTRGRITGASKRWFDGEGVVVRTASNREITCTPNHPVLTDRGWVAAGLLDVGSNVVRHVGSEREAAGDSDRENVPARIEDVAEAFLTSHLVSAVPVEVTAKDFHGDGEGSEIAVVGSDRLLPYEVDALCLEHRAEIGFVGRGLAGLVPLASGGHLAEGFEARLPASMDATGTLGTDGSLGEAHLPPLEGFSLGLAAATNAVIAEDASNHETVETELLGDGILGNAADVGAADRFLINDGARPGWYVAMLQLAHNDGVRNASLAADLNGIEAGEVELDAVVECRRIRLSHYVYNLETADGWYIADGLVVHNCRCVLSPIAKSESDEGPTIGARASSEGPVAASTTFNEFLKRQSPEFIERVLGKERAALFEAGKITVRDLVSGTGRELTLDELR
jgi:hypothetical protein